MQFLSVGALEAVMKPPPFNTAVLPIKEQFVRVTEPPRPTRAPPLAAAVLPVKVQSVALKASPEATIPPPLTASFPVNSQFVSVTVLKKCTFTANLAVGAGKVGGKCAVLERRSTGSGDETTPI